MIVTPAGQKMLGKRGAQGGACQAVVVAAEAQAHLHLRSRTSYPQRDGQGKAHKLLHLADMGDSCSHTRMMVLGTAVAVAAAVDLH